MISPFCLSALHSQVISPAIFAPRANVVFRMVNQAWAHKRWLLFLPICLEVMWVGTMTNTLLQDDDDDSQKELQACMREGEREEKRRMGARVRKKSAAEF